MKMPFIPNQGKDEIIQKQTVREGNIYFATDSGKIYLDTATERVTIGGGGVAIIYASAKNVAQDKGDLKYILYTTDLDNKEITPKKDDLIINSNGTFYKVYSFTKSSGLIKCTRIAVSGTGGGGGGGGGGGDTPGDGGKYTTIESVGTTPNAQTYIYGKSQWVEFKVESTHDALITLNYYVTNIATNSTETYSFSVMNGDTHPFDLGAVLQKGQNTLIVEAIGANSGMYQLEYPSINCIELALKESTNFNPLKYAYNSDMSFHFIPVGKVKKTLRVFIDDNLELSKDLLVTDDEKSMSVTIGKKPHGIYTLRADLAYSMGATTIYTDPLIYQIAFVDEGNSSPLVWYGSIPEKIVNHDKLNLQYMVYDPASPDRTSIRRYMNGKEIASLDNIAYSDKSWLIWNVANYQLEDNEFTIQCGTTSASVNVFVQEDENRDLNILTGPDLYLNLTSSGRSNSENETLRQEWIYQRSNGTKSVVKFNNFNWYNNGWIQDDETGDSVLRISNGASIEIPVSVMNTRDLDSNLTFELQFKLRNVQKYESLIEIKSEEIKDDKGETVDVKVTKTVKSTEGVWCNYYGNEVGLCLGTQEGFFKSKQVITSGRYKEDDIVTVSFVAEKATATNQYPLLYMYINGVLSSIINYDKTSDSFSANVQNIVINSDFCDVDLYKVRVYTTALSSADIVHNYIADRSDAQLYDMNQIIQFNNNIPSISYTKMKDYNAAHASAPLLPYAVLECVDKNEDLLPFIKGGKRYVNVEFVNPALDYAYDNGLITGEQYIMGCPSYTATNIQFDVQGTSSQGYPRRNYKCKFKKETGDKANDWYYTNGPLKGKEIGVDNEYNGVIYKNYYMDNHYSESTFTWKADYMESSMTHNTGFASFVKTLYSKHPLQDYDESIDVTDRRTTVYGFPMIVFQKKKDGSYEFIGRYNYNLDKGCNNVIGFKEKIKHPVLTDKKISEVAECWELCNNQGGRTAFTITNFAETNSKGELAVLDDFEVRYHNDADPIEEAIKLEKSFEGKTRQEANDYILSKYANLEKVAEWLKSTDTRNATNAPLNPAVTFNEYRYTAAEGVTAENFDSNEYYILDNNAYKKATSFSATKEDFVKRYLYEDTYTPGVFYTYNENSGIYSLSNDAYDSSKTYYEKVIVDVVYYTRELIYYNSDNSAYRLAKFAKEFDSWFDKEYCAIYFIMTELLIQYDSRGKNMMLASWGPKVSGGNYIWYPIFYDIDTQLGVNNSGVPSWDYDTETSPFYGPGVFSTPTSVLWYNFEQCFMTTIQNTYIDLRKNNLTYEKLKGYYDYDFNVSGSYAMKGDRPINIINVDQYWKYIAPTFSGYIDTSGKTVTDNGTRFYCLQGTRQLQRDLFLRNRFNYMDSKWLAGTYSKEGMTHAFMVRANANFYPDTSDKYLDKAVLTPQETALGFEAKPWKQPLDTDVVFKITPYLQQYGTLYFDETLMTGPVKWDGENPIDLALNAEAQRAFKEERSLQEQIFRIGGGEYISSLGDLSKFYINELNLTQLKRLKELRFGSDDPGYYNRLGIRTFALNASAINPDGTVNKDTKALLERVILTNVQQLTGALDVTGAEKLREFRALGTTITGVTFANGGQMEVVHLPDTITHLTFTEPVSLCNLITSSDNFKDSDGKFVDGLYVPGITTTGSLANSTGIEKLQIIGGNMGYSSYQLMKNLVDIKTTMQLDSTFSDDQKTIVMALEKVLWSPYKLVEYGVALDSAKTYVLKNDHSGFDAYTPTKSNWDTNTLNGLVYELIPENDAKKDCLTDLSLIKMFIHTNNIGEVTFDEEGNEKYPMAGIDVPNYFRDVTPRQGRTTYPYLSGDIYINNPSNNKISEYEIKQIVDNYYPDLNIFAAHVTPAYTLKMVEVVHDEEAGTKQIVELQTIKYNPVGTVHANAADIKVNPSRLHHYFMGWSLSEDGLVLSNEEINALAFSSSKMAYTLYARFDWDSYTATYYNGDEELGERPASIYGQPFMEPTEVPYREPANDTPYSTTRLAFLGWSDKYQSNPVASSIEEAKKIMVDVTSIKATENRKFYAVFVQEDVYDRPTDDKYFYFPESRVTVNGIEGYMIETNSAYDLKGKITIPATHNDYPIVAMGNFQGALRATGIFFMPNEYFFEVGARAFQNSLPADEIKLKGIYLPESVMYIKDEAFNGVQGLEHVSEKFIKEGVDGHLGSNIVSIGTRAFMATGSLHLFNLPPKVTYLPNNAFYNAGPNVTLSELPPALETIEMGAFFGCPNIHITHFGLRSNEVGSSSGLKKIGSSAFSNFGLSGANQSINTIYIWDSVTELSTYAFMGYGNNITVYTSFASKPAGWADDISVSSIEYGYTGEV